MYLFIPTGKIGFYYAHGIKSIVSVYNGKGQQNRWGLIAPRNRAHEKPIRFEIGFPKKPMIPNNPNTSALPPTTRTWPAMKMQLRSHLRDPLTQKKKKKKKKTTQSNSPRNQTQKKKKKKKKNQRTQCPPKTSSSRQNKRYKYGFPPYSVDDLGKRYNYGDSPVPWSVEELNWQ